MRILFLLLFVAFGAAAADVKITALPTTNVVHTVDIFPLVTQPGGASATTMSATLGVLATSLSRDQGMITNNYSPTFNNITGTNLSMYGSAGGTIKLYDASGNGPYSQLGTNDNLYLSNATTAMTVTLTNGGANFGSNVVAKHFYGDGSTLTGVGGGSGTVSNAAALTLNQFVIGQGGGAVSTTLDGSALTNTTEYGFLASSETFTNTTTMQTRATNYAIAITNRCNGDQSGGYLTNSSAGIYQISFQVGNWSGSGDKAVAILTNNVATYLRFSALLGTTRSGSGGGVISLPASVGISLGALSSDASTFGNYSFSIRRMQ